MISLTSISFAQPDKKTGKQPQGSQKVYYKSEDRSIFDKYTAYIYNKTNLPDNQLIIETAKFFLNVPYVANTLEVEPEGLVVNLRALDCTTFLETVFALAMTAKTKDLTFDNFCSKLRLIRYRDGVINDYTDRLHYTSDWIYQNEEKKIVKNVSKMAGSKPLSLNLYIMSSNTDRYKQLNGKEDLIGKIKAKESEINSREYYYLPTEEIEKRASQIKSGDMVGLVTTIPGIDISHVGIIYKEGKKLTFIHASSTHKKVVINKEPLSEYVKGTGRNTGIVLARARF